MNRIPTEGLKLSIVASEDSPPPGLNEQNPDRGIETARQSAFALARLELE